ncbi:trace amine-associated receptor 7d-like [Rhopilema esculentum]|uniref:trace amine-associated receptor 7d-like n=1 Tax=Rhopilema esculentum TaxID=499914 RepID=UPI0031E3D1FE|eukprot:gene17701-9359_t
MCPPLELPLQQLSKINIIVLLALDVVPGILTVFGNLIFLATLIKTRSLHRPSNVILGGLCVSDLLVGFVVRPLYLVFLYMILQGNYSGLVKELFSKTFFFCGGLSFCFVAQVSVDRYVAISQPYFYTRSATCKKHVYITVFHGCFWLLFSSFNVYGPTKSSSVYKAAIMGYLVICIITMLIVYSRIYCIVASKRKTVAALELVNGDTRTRAIRERRERSKSRLFAMILGFFFLSYTPYLILLTFFAVSGNSCWDNEFNFISNQWINFILLWNSCINPVIYCVKSSEIRRCAKVLMQGFTMNCKVQ